MNPAPPSQPRIVAAVVERFTLPLRRPLRTPDGFLHRREIRLLAIERDDGAVGIGEASVVDWLATARRSASGDDSAHDATGHDMALDTLAARIVADRPRASTLLAESFDERLPGAVRSALQTALLDAEARARGVTLSELLGATGLKPLPICALLASRDIRDLVDEAASLHARGFQSFKLKVGLDAEEDLERVRELRRAVGPGASLRLDANGAWDLAEARSRLLSFEPMNPDFVEEPLREQPGRLDASRELRALLGASRELRAFLGSSDERRSSLGSSRELRTLTGVALDETIRNAADLAAAIDAGAADVIVLKLERVGGPLPALALARRAFEAGLRVVFTDSIESAVGRAATGHTALAALFGAPDMAGAIAAPHIAGAIGAPDEALGLGGLFLLDDDAVPGPCWKAEGPGLGVDVVAGRRVVTESGAR